MSCSPSSKSTAVAVTSDGLLTSCICSPSCCNPCSLSSGWYNEGVIMHNVIHTAYCSTHHILLGSLAKLRQTACILCCGISYDKGIVMLTMDERSQCRQ